jgi:hypothetical protein
MIKRIVVVASLAVPLVAGVVPHARASTPVPTTVRTSGPMFCVWNDQLDISYCQYRLPRLP